MSAAFESVQWNAGRPAYPKMLLSVLLFVQPNNQDRKVSQDNFSIVYRVSKLQSAQIHIFNQMDALKNWHTMTLQHLSLKAVHRVFLGFRALQKLL